MTWAENMAGALYFGRSKILFFLSMYHHIRVFGGLGYCALQRIKGLPVPVA